MEESEENGIPDLEEYTCDLPKCGRTFPNQEDLDSHKQRCGLVSIICRICIRNGKERDYPLVCKADVDAHFESVHPKVSPDKRIAFVRVRSISDEERMKNEAEAHNSSGSDLDTKKVKLEADQSFNNINHDGALYEELNRLKFLLQQRDGENEALKQQLNVSHFDNHSLERKLQDKEEELGRVQHEKGELRATIFDQQTRIQSLEAELEATKTDHEKNLTELKRFMETKMELELDLRVSDMSEELEKVYKETEQLEEALSEKDGRLKQLQLDLNRMRQANTELEDKYEALVNESRPRMEDDELEDKYKSKIGQLVEALQDSENKRRGEQKRLQDTNSQLLAINNVLRSEKEDLANRLAAVVGGAHPWR